MNNSWYTICEVISILFGYPFQCRKSFGLTDKQNNIVLQQVDICKTYEDCVNRPQPAFFDRLRETNLLLTWLPLFFFTKT